MKETRIGINDITYTWLDDYTGELNECDIEHVGDRLKEGYCQGELLTSDENGNEHRGWWRRN
jgi:hypothetical protein